MISTEGTLGTSRDIEGKILDYVSRFGADTSFTDFFWKKCEPHLYEVERYPLYVGCLVMHSKGSPVGETSRRIGVNRQSVRSWIKFEQKPKLAHYLDLYLRLGIPREGSVWLSVNNTSGHAVPLGPVISVPTSISKWRDVATVLGQLDPLKPIERNLSREYLFGFLVGVIIGDAAKPRAKNWHRHLGLVLSKKYTTNKKNGDFTCLCARSIGLRMHAVKGQPRPSHKPHGFYEWVSQASPLVDWLFNAVLGLEDGKRTTYDPVRMDWGARCP